MEPGNWIRDARQYLVEVQGETKKITWPARKEAIAGAIGVVVISAVFVIFLGLVDFGLGLLLGLVFG
jgi:preprotein translocase subunit SecE